ncbi:MAG: alpha/beta fold hydrolase [Pseudomonadota bacterium]
MSLLRPMVWVLLGIGLIYAALCALAWGFQERLVWFPGPPPAGDPPRAENVALTTSDGVALHGWFWPGTSGRAVLVSHGNGGTVADVVVLADAFGGMGHAVLLYDYRGYGRSEGSVSEEGTYRDAEAAFDWLQAKGFPPSAITAYGHSLGGAVTIALATRRPVQALIVENTFSSLADIGSHAYPLLPVRWLSRIHYDSVARAPAITAPVLVLHSLEDELIPIAMGRKLFDAFAGPKLFQETAGGHNDGGFLLNGQTRAAVTAFIGDDG